MSERDRKAFQYAMKFLRESDAEPTDDEIRRVLGPDTESTLSEIRYYVRKWNT